MAGSQACCSSPRTIGYWCLVSLLAWGAFSLIGLYWYPLHASSAATICLAVGIGCVANWRRNRLLHCAITGPLFLLGGMVFLLAELGAFAVNAQILWNALTGLTAVAFLLEWWFAARARGGQGRNISDRNSGV